MINEIKEALEQATPEPWKWSIKEENHDMTEDDGYELGYLEHPINKVSGQIIIDSAVNKYGQHVVSCSSNHDAHLIANTPTYIRYLLDELEKWKREALQQYPTPEAYDAACAALEKHRQRADDAEKERDQLCTEHTAMKDYLTELRECTDSDMIRGQIGNVLSTIKKEVDER